MDGWIGQELDGSAAAMDESGVAYLWTSLLLMVESLKTSKMVIAKGGG